MITHATGNLLRADAEALVNTVNTVGVMGKGIALQFKKAFPEMFEAYRRAAKAGEIRLGHVHVWPTGQMTGPRYIINFPTKGHWKARSKLDDIVTGLDDLVEVVRRLEIGSIAVPPLGCGNGGLEWRDVEPRILEAFARVPDVDVQLFAPAGAPAAAEMATSTQRPTMTRGRAALVDLVDRYTRQSFMAPGLIESQKLMYFLQIAGEPLRLNFVANRYGPYADNLRHVLNVVEGHFLSGYGDGSATVAEAEPLTVLPGAVEQATVALQDAVETRERIDRVLELAAGFESAYGLELLATVHWLATRDPSVGDDVLTQQVWEWSPRKARMFTAEHVQTALVALRSLNWLPAPSVA
ncbi:type II toxin-antitoxin system antitoxin DNA ADP-ribosyl glycohydrolase DarG [Granulicoccus phenolivorans]|uniref:type II toxin-antitoxin system antitoxin DNA ADP-ribosyl glycohydrolase DarG n=1 Tax=Granulicoccus phenolivorans TaxID=266854 RepID=UPI00047A2B26|nr:macro domain-containing protein [Granulicoccus phenolivorans]